VADSPFGLTLPLIQTDAPVNTNKQVIPLLLSGDIIAELNGQSANDPKRFAEDGLCVETYIS
jgi:hypothetical protein